MNTFASASELRLAYVRVRKTLSAHTDHGPNTCRPESNERWERGQSLRASLRAMEAEWDRRWPGDRQAFAKEEDLAHAAAYRAACESDLEKARTALRESEARLSSAFLPELCRHHHEHCKSRVEAAERRLAALTSTAAASTSRRAA